MDATATFDFVPYMKEITATYEEGTVEAVPMHDGSVIRLHKIEKDWDPMNRISAINAVSTPASRARS